MPAVLLKDRLPSEVGDSDAYNRIQMRRAVLTRGDPTAEAPEGGIARELLRVLIVDDYRATADITCSLMSAWGHDVRRAYDAASGLTLAATFQPDVVLLDVMMPQMNGFELARQLRLQVQLHHCFMIAHTGRTDAECRHQCDQAGIDLFLIKPVCPSILRALLIWEADYAFRSRQEAATDCLASDSSRSPAGCDEHFGPTQSTPRIPIPI
jgi:CheY-like chemotaxis protein